MSQLIKALDERIRISKLGSETHTAVVDSVNGRVCTVSFGGGLLTAVVPALPVTLKRGMVVELGRPRGIGGQLQVLRVKGASGPAEVDRKVEAERPAICVVLSETLVVPRAQTTGEPYVWTEPAINVGGIATVDSGVWSLAAPRSGLYRLTAERADAIPVDGGASPVAGDFASSVSCLDLFVRLTVMGWSFSGGAGFNYASASGSAIVSLSEGDPLPVVYVPGGAANTEVVVVNVQTFVRFAVEYLRPAA